MRAYPTDPEERFVRAMADGQPMQEAGCRFDEAVTVNRRERIGPPAGESD